MKDKRRRIVAGIAIMLLPAFAACYNSGSGQTDAAADDAGPGDGQGDQVEAADPGSDPDLPADALDVPVEGGTACEASGGYCTSYGTEATEPCVTCTDQGGTHTRPAGAADGAMGCMSSGPDMDPWCCQPSVTGVSQCESGGGECFTMAPVEPTCPPGWIASRAMCSDASMRCCMTGASCAQE